MSETDLKRYQRKLLSLRDTCQHTNVFSLTLIAHESNLFEFHPDSRHLPPENNIFGRFTYSCRKHEPSHAGWFLLWNPNSFVNSDKLVSLMSSHCAPLEFQTVRKKIQAELEREFPLHFRLVDVYDYDFSVDYCIKYRVKYVMEYKCPLVMSLTRVATRPPPLSPCLIKQNQRLTDSTLILVPSSNLSSHSSSSSSSNDGITSSRSTSKLSVHKNRIFFCI